MRCTVAVLALLVGVRCGSAPEEPPAVRAVAPAFKSSLDTIRGDWFIVASNPNPEIRNRVVTDYITYRFAEGGSVTKEITSRGKTERQTGSYTFDPGSGLIHVRFDLGKAGVQLTSWRQLSADEAKTVHWKNVSLGYVGRKFSVYPWRKGHEPEALLPGDYTMQLVVNGSLLCFTGKEAGQDVATSERVPFRIIK